MKKLLIIAALILGSCAYDAKIDSRSTTVACNQLFNLLHRLMRLSIRGKKIV